MKKKVSFIGLLAASAVLLSACQPTPGEAAVADKSSGLLKIISEPALTTNQLIDMAPEVWKEDLDFQNGVQVNIDASIEMPDVAAYPVIEVTPHLFTQQEAQKYVDILMQGKPAFEMSTVRSKADVETDILRIKADIEHIKVMEGLTEEQRELKLQQSENELEPFEEEYQNAPAEAPEPVSAEVVFRPYSDTSEAIQIQANIDGNVPVFFEMYASVNGIDNILSFIKSDRIRKYNVQVEAKDQLAGMKLSKQDAQKIAMAFLESIGIADIDLAKTEAFSDDYADNAADDPADNPKTQKCYVFYFSRIISGIPVTTDDFSTGITGDSDKYDQVWPAELIRVWVDDSGVYGLFWGNMDNMGQVLNKNVALLDFDKIMDIFKKQIFYEKTWNNGPEYSDCMINIKKIKLGMMRVRLQDNQYVYLPVWDFIGDWTYNYTSAEGVSLSGQYDVSLLTLNAIDGSVIDRDLGY